MKHRSIFSSVRAAGRGLVYAFTHERNFRIEVAAAGAVIVALVVLRASITDYVVCFLLITTVLVAELINTALERAVDIIKPHKHPYARVIKDMSAAFVVTMACGASVIGSLIFIPLILKHF